MQVQRTYVPPGRSSFAVLTFYSDILIHDTPLVVGQATFHGVFDSPWCENRPTEWSGEYSWRYQVLTPATIDSTPTDPGSNTLTAISPPKNLYVKPSSYLRF
jgi:hypothetical protein